MYPWRLSILALLALAPVSAQLSDLNSSLRIAVQAMGPYNSSTGEVDVEMSFMNLSAKEINAFAFRTDTGIVQVPLPKPGPGGATWDSVASSAAVGRATQPDDRYVHNMPLNPGESMYSRNPMKPQTLFTVLAVVFADHTAIGDDATIDSVFRARKASADELELWIGRGLLRGSGEAKSLCSQMVWTGSPMREVLRQSCPAIAEKAAGDPFLSYWTDLQNTYRTHSVRKR